MSWSPAASFAGAGRVAIHYERHAPAAGSPRAVVLISHGYAEHVGRYRELIAHLVGRGMAAVALDHRGHGRSGGPRGHCRDFGEFVADLRQLAEAAEGWWPGVPRILFGHSLGGLVATLYLLSHPETVRAAALSGPAFRLPDDSPRWLGRLSQALGRVVPRLGIRTKLNEHLLSRDPAVGPAYAGDPLVHRRVTMGFVRALAVAQEAVGAGAARLRVPLLVLQGDADRIVDPVGAREFAARLTCHHELVMLPGYYHELLNEPAAERAHVRALLDAWIDRWCA
jgi:alpha-beta hydrolase superfamily lysophospholipase